jgi:nitroimidazol reductase NimA-like FMN-containing flavoprotein (pyridoxamine 5'-phosphate oxidase superfamily)
MVTVTGAWSRAEAAAFLEAQTVPLRLGCRRPSGDLWMLSLWYRYRDGSFECATAADADVVAYLDHDAPVSFEVSTNEPPYRGVRGNGTATVTPDEDKTVLRALLARYLGGTDSDLAERLLSPSRREVTVRISPDRLHSWDYSDRM